MNIATWGTADEDGYEYEVFCPDGKPHESMPLGTRANAERSLAFIAKYDPPYRVGDGGMDPCPEGLHVIRRRRATIHQTFPWEDT